MDTTNPHQNAPDGGNTFTVMISHKNVQQPFTLPATATVLDLQSAISTSESISISPEHQKLIAPKLGVLRDPSMPITSLPQPPRKIILMGSSPGAVSNAQAANAPGA